MKLLSVSDGIVSVDESTVADEDEKQSAMVCRFFTCFGIQGEYRQMYIDIFSENTKKVKNAKIQKHEKIEKEFVYIGKMIVHQLDNYSMLKIWKDKMS